MNSNLFEQAKTISTQQAAERYAGLIVTGTKRTCKCPFPDHMDSNASFKLYEDGSFYCFGCHRGGTSIEFTADWYGIGKREAAKKLCEDFGLQVSTKPTDTKEPARPSRKDIQAAVAVFDTTVVNYVKACTSMLKHLAYDKTGPGWPESTEKARVNLLRQRELAQRLSEELLQASQDQDEKRLEQLMVDNAEWVKQIRQDLANAKKYNVTEVFDDE